MGRAFEFRKSRKMKRWSEMSKVFTRIGKDISIAVKEGGPDRDTNFRLRQIIQNAKTANMPKDNIERAIKKASESEADNYIEISLEGYGPFGIAIFLDCATDNNKRTVANVRSYFSKFEGNLGTNGSLEFLFERKGAFTICRENILIDLEELEMELIDVGLQELEIQEDVIIAYCDFKESGNMQKHLEMMEIQIESFELQRIPNSTKTISAQEAKLVIKLLDKLEEDNDVQQVFHNMKITKEILNEIH